MIRHHALRNLALAQFACILCLVCWPLQSFAGKDLQLSYDVATKSDKKTAEPASTLVARASADVDTPLRLEYELISQIGRLNQTANELRSIVEAMPGPTLPRRSQVAPPYPLFATPLEETISRLNHVEKLIADITLVITAMPYPGAPAPTEQTPVPAAVVPAPVKPKPHRPQPTPVPPEPVQPPSPVSAFTLRFGLMALGGVIAALLARQLRKMYLRRQPSAKDYAAKIDAPPLKDESIELADVMSSMGMADGATEALIQSIRSNPRQSLTHWMKLLDVYRQTGQQTNYEQAADEMRKGFNVKLAQWGSEIDDADKDATLESYPHIATQLKKLWPNPECSEFLLSLLADNREGKREGFPLAVIEEIVLLLAVLRPES